MCQLVCEGVFIKFGALCAGANQPRHLFYHGYGGDGEWMGLETTNLEVYPDRIRQIYG